MSDQSRQHAETGGSTVTGNDDPATATGDDPSTATGSDHEYPDPAEPLSLDDALSIVGEETRARILVELGEAVRDDGLLPATLSFSELMERVGAEDSGRFNYHLDKLVGTFVLKTEEGYQLRPPGHFLYRAVVAGRLTGRADVDPFEVGECPDCGTELVAEYPISNCFYVRCRECETFEHIVSLPAAGFDGRRPRDALTAAVRKRHHEVALMRHGVCHGCGADVETTLDPEGTETWNAVYDYDVYAALSCAVCNVGGFGHPALVALVTPPVVSFLDEHARDAYGAVPWEAPLAGAKRETNVHDDGARVTVPFAVGDDRLTVTLDDDLAVVATERE
jgi:DNA-binding transcriptional ArsR family regulator